MFDRLMLSRRSSLLGRYPPRYAFQAPTHHSMGAEAPAELTIPAALIRHSKQRVFMENLLLLIPHLFIHQKCEDAIAAMQPWHYFSIRGR